MPEQTLEAVADHGEIKGDQVRPFYDDAAAVFAALKDAGIDYDDVIDVLIKEGVEKFVTAFDDLGASVEKAMRQAGSDR
jgi:transaldolase